MADDFEVSSVAWVNDEDALAHLIEELTTCEEVVLDLETTMLNEHGQGARIVLAQFTVVDATTNPTTYLVPLSHPDSPWLGHWRRVMRRIGVALRDSGTPIIGHNVKFDARWVKAHSGVDLAHLIVWDTQISSHLLDENASTKLKERAPDTFGVARWDEFDLSVPFAAERVSLIDLGLYGARDTYWTWRLSELHREQMFVLPGADDPDPGDETEDARLGRLAIWCAMPTTATLTAIEQRGITLDKNWAQEQMYDHQAKASVLFDQLSTMYPRIDPEGASFAPTSTWFREWTQAAVDSGDLKIAELTPTGRARWSKGVLVRQTRGGSQVASMLLEHRGHTKKAEFLNSWLTLVSAEGQIHSTYNAGSVMTGRLSSSSPNMQQVTALLKPAFVPAAGFVFADLDYSQIELRVAAFISRCIPMLEAFRRGDDLHSMLARQITGHLSVTKDERQHAKAGNFGFLYGQSPYGFREYAEAVYDIAFTMGEAVRIHKAFFDTWEGISAWHTRVVARTHSTGQISSPIGRIRRLPGVWDENPAMSGGAERAAINSPVQGFASDLMQIAAASIEGMLPGVEPVRDARIVATVHDSILVEVPADNWEVVTKECQARMVNVGEILTRMDCVLDVPLAAEAKCGTRWGLSDIGILE